ELRTLTIVVCEEVEEVPGDRQSERASAAWQKMRNACDAKGARDCPIGVPELVVTVARVGREKGDIDKRRQVGNVMPREGRASLQYQLGIDECIRIGAGVQDVAQTCLVVADGLLLAIDVHGVGVGAKRIRLAVGDGGARTGRETGAGAAAGELD